MLLLHVPPLPPQQGSLAKPHSQMLLVALHVRLAPHGLPRQQGCWLLPHALHMPVILLQPSPLGHTGHVKPEPLPPLAAPEPPLAEPVPPLAVPEPPLPAPEAPLVDPLPPLEAPLVDGNPPSGAMIATIEAPSGSVTVVPVIAPAGGAAVMTWTPPSSIETSAGLAQ